VGEPAAAQTDRRITPNAAAARVRPPAVAVLEEVERAEQVRPPNDHLNNEMEL
jgi:hypothetical protein